MSPAIKSKNFDFSLLYLEAPERKKFEGFSFTSILIKYVGEDCLVKGNCKLFQHNNKGKKSYSLGLRIDDGNRECGNLYNLKIQMLAVGKLPERSNQTISF